jgi:hypothetical protein
MIVIVNQRSEQPVSLCCLTWEEVTALEAWLLQERFLLAKKRPELARQTEAFIAGIEQAYKMATENIDDFEFVRDLRLDNETGSSDN